MSEFPTSVFTPRETENLPGITFDPDDKKNLYSEDYQALGDEIEAVEQFLTDAFTGDLTVVLADPAGTHVLHFDKGVLIGLD